MSLTDRDVEEHLNAATDALRHARERIEQAQTGSGAPLPTLLDEADQFINTAEGIIDSLHYTLTRLFGPNHMALEFGRAGLALLQAREGVQKLRDANGAGDQTKPTR